MAVINANRFNFAEVVNKYLLTYKQECVTAMTSAITQTARETAKMLRETSPVDPNSKKSGAYAKGWTYKLDKGRLRTGAVIYGKKGTYNLAHLLEYGHVLRNGGRTVGEASARPHIHKVEQWAIKEFEQRLKRELGG